MSVRVAEKNITRILSTYFLDDSRARCSWSKRGLQGRRSFVSRRVWLKRSNVTWPRHSGQYNSDSGGIFESANKNDTVSRRFISITDPKKFYEYISRGGFPRNWDFIWRELLFRTRLKWFTFYKFGIVGKFVWMGKKGEVIEMELANGCCNSRVAI